MAGWWTAAGVLAALAVAGCGGGLDLAARDEAVRRPTAEFARNLPADLRRVSVFAATTRAPGDPEGDLFTGFRAARPHFVAHEVSVPPERDTLDAAKAPNERASDPARHFVVAAQTAMPDVNAFVRRIAAALKPGQRVVVFVHGYNTSYRDALVQMVTLAERRDSGVLPVLFSFASQGALSGYGYDKDSALVARPVLADVIERLTAAASGRIDIAAHSMGTWLTVEALQLLAARQGAGARGRIGALLLASPDIDVDLMDVVWPRIRDLPRQTLVLCHEGDVALKASSVVGGGGQRVGALPDCDRAIATRYAGARVINVADFAASQRDRLLHNPGTNDALVERVIALAPR